MSLFDDYGLARGCKIIFGKPFSMRIFLICKTKPLASVGENTGAFPGSTETQRCLKPQSLGQQSGAFFRKLLQHERFHLNRNGPGFCFQGVSYFD